MANEAKWYVAHTYSGYENKVKANIEKTVENRGLGDVILAVEVPMEEIVEKKENGEEVISKHKIFPSYVLIKMVMTDESWYIVRNTRGVTGFVGPGSKPVPLSEAEVLKFGVEQTRTADIKFSVGDLVNVVAGPMEGFSGTVESIDSENNLVKIKLSMFGRDQELDIEPSQIVLCD